MLFLKILVSLFVITVFAVIVKNEIGGNKMEIADRVTCCICKKELPANSIRYDVTKHKRIVCDECVDQLVEKTLKERSQT